MTEEDKSRKYDAYLARQREHSRNYRKAHRAERAAYYKLWYQKNKTKLATRRREKRVQAHDHRNQKFNKPKQKAP